MDKSDRKKAIVELKFLMTKLRDVPSTYPRFSNAEEPLPEEFSLILKFLTTTCQQLTHRQDESPQSNEAVINAKQLCAAARILRQILHVQQVSDYRALGLNDGATQKQIHSHYRWLSNLFAFDKSIDPEHRGVRRIMQAYITLKGSSLTANEQMVSSIRVPEANQRNHLEIIASALVILIVSGGLSWWWLLSNRDIPLEL